MDLLDVDGLAPVAEKRARVGRAHDEILGPAERDIQCSATGCSARGTLLNAGLPERGEPLAETLAAQAIKLDGKFTADPQAVIAAVLEACVFGRGWARAAPLAPAASLWSARSLLLTHCTAPSPLLTCASHAPFPQQL